MKDWDMSKRSRKCIECGVYFSMGDHYNTGLQKPLKKKKKDSNQGGNDPLLTREEYCPDCWPIVAERIGFDYSWRGRVSESKKVLDKPIKRVGTHKESLQQIFKDAIKESHSSTDDDVRFEKNALAYLLGLYMERKRWLVSVEKETSGDTNLVHYRIPGDENEEVYSIIYPVFSQESLTQLQEKLKETLELPIEDEDEDFEDEDLLPPTEETEQEVSVQESVESVSVESDDSSSLKE